MQLLQIPYQDISIALATAVGLLSLMIINLLRRFKRETKIETTLLFLQEAHEKIQAAITREMLTHPKGQQVYGHIAKLNALKRELAKLMTELPPENNIPKYNNPPAPPPLSEQGQTKLFNANQEVSERLRRLYPEDMGAWL